MDETSIALVPKASRGVVMRFPRALHGRGGRFRATSTQQRTNLTYAAIITDWPPLQALLPQFIIGSTTTAFPQRTWSRLFASSPDTIFLLRGRTAWNTVENMVQMIRVLGVVCHTARPDAALSLIHI